MMNETMPVESAIDELLQLRQFMATAREAAQLEGRKPLLGSLPARMKLLLDQVYDDMLDLEEMNTSDFDFKLGQKESEFTKPQVAVAGEVFSGFQSVTTSAGRVIAKLPARHAGPPEAELRTQLTLLVDYLRPRKRMLGMSFARYGLFPDLKLQDAAGEYLSDVVLAINQGKFTTLKNYGANPGFVNKLGDICATLSRNFGESSFTYRSRRSDPSQLDNVTKQRARNYVQQLSPHEEIEQTGRLIVINFETERLELRATIGKVSMYYDSDTVSDDIIRQGANRIVRVKGTLTKSKLGVPQRLFAKTLEIVEP
jgi:hypothetical protein